MPHYKLLVLILDSPDEIYNTHRDVWKAYMNSDLDNIQCLFLRQGPVSETTFDASTQTLFCPGTESLIPGVLEKTLHGFAYCMAHYTFDYLLRTNISSFFVFPIFKEVFATLPRIGCYAGVQGFDGFPFVSGAGMVLSPDVVLLLVQNMDKIDRGQIDDLAIAAFLNGLRYKQTVLRRFDFVNDTDVAHDSVKLALARAQNTYHFRIKNAHDRVYFDSHYMKLLLKTYYGLEMR
jgi:hypothetical protein